MAQIINLSQSLNKQHLLLSKWSRMAQKGSANKHYFQHQEANKIFGKFPSELEDFQNFSDPINFRSDLQKISPFFSLSPPWEKDSAKQSKFNRFTNAAPKVQSERPTISMPPIILSGSN